MNENNNEETKQTQIHCKRGGIMSAQWIIKGLDPVGASVVTPSRAHKYINPHACPFRAASQERYRHTYAHA